ncbi:MAG TPA: SAM-dependent chlorinase/fluorinase [Anaerolineae bacterium]|nr:SAM-dependent chlorinase/fluorinase [Anaerolineae bacterium]
MTKLITLTTDFGLSDGYVGTMRGVILNIAPDATIVDISHDISPQNIQQGALVLAHSVPYFPERAIHVCIVDPGVGSVRKPIAVALGETIFIAPDNGVISSAVAALSTKSNLAPRAFELTNPRYRLPRVSMTFHGRDIFSPAAAHLANGVPLEEIGTPLNDFVKITPPAPKGESDGSLVGHIVYIDRFGNIATDIQESHLAAFDPARVYVTVRGHTLKGLKRTFSETERGELLALINSSGNLEIAQRDGNAAQALNVRVGDTVRVTKE